MAYLISLRTAKLDPSKEPPNTINPIAGQSILVWLRDHVLASAHQSTEPDMEDWGWYIDVEVEDTWYMVGGIGYENEDDDSDEHEWLIQVHKHRSLMDKLRGRNKLEADDPLLVTIVGALRADPGFTEVEIHHQA